MENWRSFMEEAKSIDPCACKTCLNLIDKYVRETDGQRHLQSVSGFIPLMKQHMFSQEEHALWEHAGCEEKERCAEEVLLHLQCRIHPDGRRHGSAWDCDPCKEIS